MTKITIAFGSVTAENGNKLSSTTCSPALKTSLNQPFLCNIKKTLSLINKYIYIFKYAYIFAIIKNKILGEMDPSCGSCY